MKRLFFYATPEFLEFDEPQPNVEKLVTCMLTEQMVIYLIGQHANGAPPYRLIVPPTMLYEAHCWNIPKTLLEIIPSPELPNDTEPLAAAMLDFYNLSVIITARRCVAALPCFA